MFRVKSYSCCLFHKTFLNNARYYSAAIRGRELSVETFCNIHVNVPFNVTIKPLDVHRYPNCDKLIFKIIGGDQSALIHNLDQNNIYISSNVKKKLNNTVCYIEAPIKANLHLVGEGDMNVGYFDSDKLILKAEGNIHLDKFQGKSIDVQTNNGDIKFWDSIQSAVIKAQVHGIGSITTEKLQGQDLNLKTKNGNVTVGSTYCANTSIEIENGNLHLNNAHQNCKVLIKNGQLYINTLDGSLSSTLKNGTANICIARILSDSDIVVENGVLNLKITDECQKEVFFSIDARDCKIDNSVKLISTNNNTLNDNKYSVDVICKNASVNISPVTWQEMLHLMLVK